MAQISSVITAHRSCEADRASARPDKTIAAVAGGISVADRQDILSSHKSKAVGLDGLSEGIAWRL